MGKRVAQRWVGAATLVFLLAACASSADAVIFNPCRQEAHVSRGSPQLGWIDRQLVPASSAVVIKRFLLKAGDYVRIDFGSGQTSILKTPATGTKGIPREGPVPVAIPASDCP
jgi:hypothetical protein